MPSLLTIGQIAQELNQPLHRVEYVIDSRQIEPSGRAGRYRVFDSTGVQLIRDAIKGIDRRRELAQA